MTADRARPSPLGPAFRTLLTANVAASLADGITRTAFPLLAARLTDDPLLVSGIAIAANLPWLFFAIPLGVLLDRVDRRRAMSIAGALRAAVAVTLAVLAATGTLTIWLLLAVALVFATLEILYDGAIRAIPPAILPRRELPRANSRIEGAEIVIQQFLSGPVTSWLLAISALVPLVGAAGGYVVAAALAFLLPAAAAGSHRETAAPRERGAWRADLTSGYRFIRRHDTLWPLWLLSIAIALCHAMVMSTFVLYVLDELRVPEAWFGTFLLVGAAGAVLGSVVAAPLQRRFRTGPLIAAINLLGLLCWFAMGVFPDVVLAAVCMAIGWGTTTVWNVHIMSLRQSLIPGHLVGRVHGTWRTLLWGAMPIGSLLGGLLARGGLTLPLLVGAGAGIVVSLLGYRFLSRLPDPADVRTDTIEQIRDPDDPPA